MENDYVEYFICAFPLRHADNLEHQNLQKSTLRTTNHIGTRASSVGRALFRMSFSFAGRCICNLSNAIVVLLTETNAILTRAAFCAYFFAEYICTSLSKYYSICSRAQHILPEFWKILRNILSKKPNSHVHIGEHFCPHYILFSPKHLPCNNKIISLRIFTKAFNSRSRKQSIYFEEKDKAAIIGCLIAKPKIFTSSNHFWWRWGESNPCPKTVPDSAVYSLVYFNTILFE